MCLYVLKFCGRPQLQDLPSLDMFVRGVLKKNALLREYLNISADDLSMDDLTTVFLKLEKNVLQLRVTPKDALESAKKVRILFFRNEFVNYYMKIQNLKFQIIMII